MAPIIPQDVARLNKSKLPDTGGKKPYWLTFEWIGGLIVKQQHRKPLDPIHLRHGGVGWFITHFVLITTFFLAGIVAGKTLLP